MSPGERKKRQQQKERRRRARERRQGEKREWNQLFHYKLEKEKPKKKYVKMSDRTIKVDTSQAKLPRPEARSKSTIHSSAQAGAAPRLPARQRYDPQQSLDGPGGITLNLPSIEERNNALTARRRALETIKKEVENRVNSPDFASPAQVQAPLRRAGLTIES